MRGELEGEVAEEWWVGVTVRKMGWVRGGLVSVEGAVGDAYYGGTGGGPGWWEAHFEKVYGDR